MSVSGKLAPETEKPAPVSVAEWMVTAVAPVEDSVIDFVVLVPTETLPKLRLDELRLSPGAAAPSCNAKFSTTPPAFAESVVA